MQDKKTTLGVQSLFAIKDYVDKTANDVLQSLATDTQIHGLFVEVNDHALSMDATPIENHAIDANAFEIDDNALIIE